MEHHCGAGKRQSDASSVRDQLCIGHPGSPVTPIIITVEPAFTPVLGINGDCAQGNSTFSHRGCWTGRIADGFMFVATDAPWSDLTQGTIIVYTSTLDLGTYGEVQRYETPTHAGELTVIDVVWPLLTVASFESPSLRFTFNLDTRQWITPTPGPIPSRTITPIPSVSPLPTQLP